MLSNSSNLASLMLYQIHLAATRQGKVELLRQSKSISHSSFLSLQPLAITLPALLSVFQYNPIIMGAGTSHILDSMVEETNFDHEEVDRLRKRFMKLDKDNSGAIDREEFLSIPAIANNPLATRLIEIFDEDAGGDVDFQEFITGLSAFSTKGQEIEKLRFAFKVYDMDRDGYISNGELFLVLKMMVGNNLKEGQLQQIVDKTIMEADEDGDGKLSFEEFAKMVENTDISKSMTVDFF